MQRNTQESRNWIEIAIIFPTKFKYFYNAAKKKDTMKLISQFSPLPQLNSKHHAELRRVRATRGQNLPPAGLELVGDGAVAGQRHLIRGGGDRTEFEKPRYPRRGGGPPPRRSFRGPPPLRASGRTERVAPF